MGRPHRAHIGAGSVSSRAMRQSWQNGTRRDVSSIRAHRRQGAGNTSEASASQIPPTWERTVPASRVIIGVNVQQEYSGGPVQGIDKFSPLQNKMAARTLFLLMLPGILILVFL